MKYIIIAGPQAAGKTTTKKYLENKYENQEIIFLQNSRNIVNKNCNPGGALTVTRNLEFQMIEEDLNRLKTIEEKSKINPNSIYVDETGIFTLAHSGLYNINIKDYFKEYINLLSKLNPKIIFLDVNPEISWTRRKEKYEKRIENFDENEKINARKELKNYMNFVYPKLIKMFEKINLPKIKIDNQLNKEEAMKNIERIFYNIVNYGC